MPSPSGPLLDEHYFAARLGDALAGVDLPGLGVRVRGKVRDIYAHGDKLILVTTDRLSAFDRILGLVPFKGQVLNQLAAFWFDQTRDVVPNHLVAVPDPNVTVARRCRPLAVEVVVRGYITGVTSTALWQRYSQGERDIYGLRFPDGLQKNDPLPAPILTPTTKAADGGHDERITPAEITARGLMTPAQWDEVVAAALALFARGQQIAARAGLILVDTKYEFGLDDGDRITLIDEIHTPDSSRFWIAATYAERRAAGLEPENFDKEFVRLHYAARGYRGEGEPLPLPPDLAAQAAARYAAAYTMLTGCPLTPGETPAAQRIARNVAVWLEQP